MQRILSGSPKFIVAFLLVLSVWGCTKIDTTTLGSDLIPAVDNVHTFADTLLINGTQGIFNDTFTRVSYTDYHALGSITNDPVFGTTSSDLYLQLKPNYYPFYFGNAGDTINNVIAPVIGSNGTSFDSAVLCLSYKTFFGDTTAPQKLSVYQLDNGISNFKDSSYKLDFRPDQTAGETLIGSITMDPRRVRDYIFFKGSKKDSVTNQIRIKLDNSFLQSLIGPINRDTSFLTSMYRSDSLFKDKIKGFRIKAEGIGNGLFYVSLTDATTRLEVHYKKVRNNVIDTAYSSFYFSTGLTSSISSQATHMDRVRSGAEVSSPNPDALYIQTTPGTYANLSIPALSGFQNSIIHRAEIVVEQIPTFDALDKSMLPPAYLYLDLLNDTAVEYKFKPVYYDLNPSSTYLPDNHIYFLPTAGIDYTYFGGYLRQKTAGGGNARYYYTFNISRHVQHIVTNGINNYNFRLYAPVSLSYYGFNVAFRNLLADGRVKIGNGTNGAGYKMYMRIVYSKI
ncbi:MAG: DUF4270 family protein [Chitinophagaceae bacterium]|nr:DUF4270 family protein [Chitinophagaceae bacterium]